MIRFRVLVTKANVFTATFNTSKFEGIIDMLRRAARKWVYKLDVTFELMTVDLKISKRFVQ
jgi:hypothetical protein